MIEIIPREKAESLDTYIQGVKSKIYSYPDCAYLLISDERLFSTSFDIAIVSYGEIKYLSDEKYRDSVQDFLAQNNL